MNTAKRPLIVIAGCGFAGLWAARRLARAQADILVLDRNNYHTFQPLLYQVAAAELEPEDIVYPVRSILHRHKNARFLMDDVTGVDFPAKVIKTAERDYRYDYLILAVGSTPHFYGISGAAEYAFQLKTLEHAVILRNQILASFECALRETDPQKLRQMLTFTILGGGPTGVEFSGALAELINGR
jgi:NADH:quinone reductase (non-electrogenic)